MFRISRMMRVASGTVVFVAFLFSLLGFGAGVARAGAPTGAVYVLTNAASGNAVAVFPRSAGGSLGPAVYVPTGGLGTGSGLGSQGALTLSGDGRWLFAVNAGSNSISSLAVLPNGLVLISKVRSGGIIPVSLTVHQGVLYVLNEGDAVRPGNIAGFSIATDGSLHYIASSTRPLSSSAPGSTVGAAEVSFNPAGNLLVVTEKATNLIDLYAVDGGIAQSPKSVPSKGNTPFGFAFNPRGTLIVSEASSNALSSYTVAGGSLVNITASSPTYNLAPCWVAVTGDSLLAYTTDAHNGKITGFRIGQNGNLTILNTNGVTASPGGTPIDLALSLDSHLLYDLNAGTHTINGFMVQPGGGLLALGNSGIALPASSVGLAVR